MRGAPIGPLKPCDRRKPKVDLCLNSKEWFAGLFSQYSCRHRLSDKPEPPLSSHLPQPDRCDAVAEGEACGPVNTTAGNSDAAFLRTGSRDRVM